MQQINHKNILIVDDDKGICELLSEYLDSHGVSNVSVNSAADARKALELYTFDAIVLDIMMPEESGIEFARYMRSTADDNTPIIFLSAMGEVNDRINGLESGGDDYLVKPFDPRELILRINNITKRVTTNKKANMLDLDPYKFNLESKTLHDKDGNEIYLTSTESQLLFALSQSPNVSVSRYDLCSRNGINLSPKTIDVQINRLRKKIEPNPKEPTYIKTIRHEGYKLCIK